MTEGEALCIGGPLDGQTIGRHGSELKATVVRSLATELLAPDNVESPAFAYKFEELGFVLGSGEYRWWGFYAPASEPDRHAFIVQSLVDGYRKPPEPTS